MNLESKAAVLLDICQYPTYSFLGPSPGDAISKPLSCARHENYLAL